MPTLRPIPILTLCLEDGPDDGQIRPMAVTTSVVPPERLEPSTGGPGAYVRQPELPAAGTWRYMWSQLTRRET